MIPPVALEGLGLLAGEVSYRMLTDGVDNEGKGTRKPEPRRLHQIQAEQS